MNLNIKTTDMFEDGVKRILIHDEPNYRCWLNRVSEHVILVEEEYPDLQGLFDANAAESAAFSNNSRHGDMVKVASTPQWLYRKWEEECRRDPECMRRKLNDPDNAKFRTNGWRL